MSYRNLFSLGVTAILTLVACTPVTTAPPTPLPPTALIELPTHTPAPVLTNTPIPPTTTPRPSPTPTQPPPTATPTMVSTATPIAESAFDGVRVNFIFNEGFLITVGDQRILIDAIYKGHTGGVLKPLLDSQPPFDGVDLILATHEHHDHFDPELVLHYLQNNPETLFAATPNAVDAILALDSSMQPRLTAVDLRRGEYEHLNLAGIDLEAVHLSHGMPGILNIGFIINFDEVKLFHMGDMDPIDVKVSDLQAYGLPGKQIDIAFVHEYLLTEDEFHAHISEGIQANHLIPMHFGGQPPLGLESIFPNLSILQEPYESWVMP